ARSARWRAGRLSPNHVRAIAIQNATGRAAFASRVAANCLRAECHHAAFRRADDLRTQILRGSFSEFRFQRPHPGPLRSAAGPSPPHSRAPVPASQFPKILRHSVSFVIPFSHNSRAEFSSEFSGFTISTP